MESQLSNGMKGRVGYMDLFGRIIRIVSKIDAFTVWHIALV